MKCSKQEIIGRFHKIPSLRFEDQQLTSFGGLVVIQALFQWLDLKPRIKACFRDWEGSESFGPHRIVLWFIVHLLLGFRRLRDVDYYRDDPMVLRVLGLRRLPDMGTISRTLRRMGRVHVQRLRRLLRQLVVDALVRERFARLTLDFDGSVLSTKGHAEGTAVGFNPKKKGARSYYPLFCTNAQTGQFLDFHHRPGNSHDRNGALEFMIDCFDEVRSACPQAELESRMDSAFFDREILNLMDLYGVGCTVSVPFERMPVLKGLIERRRRWKRLDGSFDYFESDWKPSTWHGAYRFLFVRQRVRRQTKGPLQLDLFRPAAFDYDYRVLVTNRTESAHHIVRFHHGRGTQEAIFGEARQHTGLDMVPTRRLHANQVVTLCAMMAHNLGRQLQMLASEREPRAGAKRPAAWLFQTIDTLRHRFIQRAGRLVEPQGDLTLVLSPNPMVEEDVTHLLDALDKAA